MRKAGVLKLRRKAKIPTAENRKGTKASIEKRWFPEMLSFGAVVQRLQGGRERRKEEEVRRRRRGMRNAGSLRNLTVGFRSYIIVCGVDCTQPILLLIPESPLRAVNGFLKTGGRSRPAFANFESRAVVFVDATPIIEHDASALCQSPYLSQSDGVKLSISMGEGRSRLLYLLGALQSCPIECVERCACVARRSKELNDLLSKLTAPRFS